MLQLHFEVFGKVQGVWFRKYTVQEARRLGISGYCQNTSSGSVRGVAECDSRSTLQQFQQWLAETGSPKSRIERIEAEIVETPEGKYHGFDKR
ncbi:hypothetical protein P9112_007606 [Eukaryota sp. TZLM1-RC]